MTTRATKDAKKLKPGNMVAKATSCTTQPNTKGVKKKRSKNKRDNR